MDTVTIYKSTDFFLFILIKASLIFIELKKTLFISLLATPDNIKFCYMKYFKILDPFFIMLYAFP